MFGFTGTQTKKQTVANRSRQRTTNDVIYGNPVGFHRVASVSTPTTVTLSAYDILGGVIDQDPSGGAVTSTLATAQELVENFAGVGDGSSISFIVRNIGSLASETITIAPGAGITVATGTTVLVPADSVGAFMIILSDTATTPSGILYNTSSSAEGDIAGLQAQIDTNAADITTNTTDIATNTGNISTNATNIGTNTTDIATNTGNISTNATNIATNVSDISTNTTNIATNVSDISDLQDKPWARIVLSSRVTCNSGTTTTINTWTSGGDSTLSGISLNSSTNIKLPEIPNRRYLVTFQIWITEANATSNSFLQIRGVNGAAAGTDLVRKVPVRLPGGNEQVSQACNFIVDSDDISGGTPDYRFFFRFENNGGDACIVENDESILLITQV
jgi:hypothetical protein